MVCHLAYRCHYVICAFGFMSEQIADLAQRLCLIPKGQELFTLRKNIGSLKNHEWSVMLQNFHVPSLMPTYCGRHIALTPPEVCIGAMPFANQHYSGGVTKAFGNQHQSFLAIVVPVYHNWASTN